MVSTTLLIIVISIVAVAGMVLALCITLIRKGHHIQSEVGENDEMKKRGLMCASDEMRREEALLRNPNHDPLIDCYDKGCHGCSSCTPPPISHDKKS